MACPIYHLSGRKVCERVKQRGMLWKGRHLHARIIIGTPRNRPIERLGLYIGVLTPGTLHRLAVKRNRMRRRCREACRITVEKESNICSRPVQLLLIPRSSSLSAPFLELCNDAEKLYSFLLSTCVRSNPVS